MHFGSKRVLKSPDNPECKPNSSNHGKWPAWHGSMLSLPHITIRHFLLFKSSQTSDTPFRHSEGPSQLVGPSSASPSSKCILTASEPAPSLFPSWPLVPQPNFSRDRSINTSQSRSQFCQIHARKSLFTIPSLCLIYFYPYPSLHIMKLIRDIFTLPGLGLKLN